MAVILTGSACQDPVGDRPLPFPIGPFVDADSAEKFMEQFPRLWGPWEVVPLENPKRYIDEKGLVGGNKNS